MHSLKQLKLLLEAVTTQTPWPPGMKILLHLDVNHLDEKSLHPGIPRESSIDANTWADYSYEQSLDANITGYSNIYLTKPAWFGNMCNQSLILCKLTICHQS